MKKTMLATAFLAAAFASAALTEPAPAAAPKRTVPVFGAQIKKPRPNHIPATTDGIRDFVSAAKKLRHVELVNVAGAVPDADWAVITRYVAETMPMAYWTNTIPKSVTMDLVTGALPRHESVLGEKAAIAVFVEKDGSGRPSFLASAGRWASVDLTRALASAPDEQTRKDRTAKYLMKAIAYAIGGGASMEANSTLSGRVVSLAQLDETAIVCPPMSLFPLVEAVNALTGGEGGYRPMPEEDEEEAPAAK